MSIKYKKINALNVPLDTTQFEGGILLDENSTDVQKALKDINDNFEDTQVEVIDNLSSTSTTSALSANQGKKISEALDEKEPADSNIVKDGSYVHTDNNYTDTEKTKLSNVADGATADQSKSDIESLEINASSLTQDSSNRFVSDTEKNDWDGKVTNANHTGDVSGDTTLTIGDNKVTYAKIQNISTNQRILGRTSGDDGDIEELTGAQIRTIINVENGATADQSKSDIEDLAIDASSITQDSSNRLVTDAEKSSWTGKLGNSDVIDNNTSTDTDLPLSANQGKVLKGYIDTINSLLTSDDTTLDDLQEVVSYIKTNKETLDTLGISNISGLEDTLEDKLNKNTSITGSTNTKITYDSNGLITSAEDATTSDITDTTDKRYITDANNTKIGHISITQDVDLDAMESDISDNNSKVSNVTTNLTTTYNEDKIIINSSDGTNATINAADTDNAGIMTKTIYDDHVLNNAKVTNYNQTKEDIDALNIKSATSIKLENARTIALSGDVTGSASFDGSANISISSTVNNDSHSHQQVYIPDTRGEEREPSYYPDRNTSFDFQNKDDTLAGNDTWHVLQTIAKWSGYDDNHVQEQIAYTGGNLKHRLATSDTTWGDWETIAYKSDTVAASLTSATITGLTSTVAELNYSDGVTSNIQSQLNNRTVKPGNHTENDTDYSPVWENNSGTLYTSTEDYKYNPSNKRLTTGQFASTVATGTAPFTVASTTKVTNLNADLLDGLSSGSFLRSNADDTITGSLLWSGDQDYDGLYWGEQHKDADAHSGAWGYIRQSTSGGQLEIGSDDLINFYETDSRVLAVSISANAKTLDAKGGLKENGVALSTKYVQVPSGGAKGDILLHDGTGYKKLPKGEDDEILAVRDGEVVWDVPRL